MASSSSEDDDLHSQSGASEDNAGRRLGYQQASAHLLNPMGYDIIVESQPLPAEAPTTYHQASAVFVNPMGYDEVEPIETTRSRVRSIFSGSSNHSGRSRASDKGQKPFIEGTHLGGGPASTKGSDLHSDANLHGSIGVGLAPAKSPVPRSGGFATAAGANQRLNQELSEQTRAFTLECED